MKRDFEKYQKANLLRKNGKSIRTIAKELKVSTSTASIWCKDIILSLKQKALLQKRGKLPDLLRYYARLRHQDKLNRHKKIFSQAQKEIKKLKNNEFFLTGLALYWAEGFKSEKEQQVGFCNSDPRMIKFILKWFRKSLRISEENFILRAEFNITHKSRGEEIENYWSALTGIPRSQFNKPYLQKAKWNRDYKNKQEYYGVLRIKIRKSSELLVKLRGWITGLAAA